MTTIVYVNEMLGNTTEPPTITITMSSCLHVWADF